MPELDQLRMKIREIQENGFSDDQIVNFLNTKTPYKKEIDPLLKRRMKPNDILKRITREPGFLEDPLRATYRGAAQLAKGAIGMGAFAWDLPMMLLEGGSYLLGADSVKKVFHYAQTRNLFDATAVAAGFDLKPHGTTEHAMDFLGMLATGKPVTPATIRNFVAKGLVRNSPNPKTAWDTAKALSPKIVESLGAGLGMQIAEEEDMGVIGTLGSMIVGQATGKLAYNTPAYVGKKISSVKNSIQNSIQNIPTIISKSRKDEISMIFAAMANETGKRNAMRAELSGLPMDMGTLTGNGFVNLLQKSIKQNPMYGEKMEDFFHLMMSQYEAEVERVYNTVGALNFNSKHQFGETLKDFFRRKGYERMPKAPAVKIAKFNSKDYINWTFTQFFNDVNGAKFSTRKEAVDETIKAVETRLKLDHKPNTQLYENLKRETAAQVIDETTIRELIKEIETFEQKKLPSSAANARVSSEDARTLSEANKLKSFLKSRIPNDEELQLLQDASNIPIGKSKRIGDKLYSRLSQEEVNIQDFKNETSETLKLYVPKETTAKEIYDITQGMRKNVSKAQPGSVPTLINPFSYDLEEVVQRGLEPGLNSRQQHAREKWKEFKETYYNKPIQAVLKNKQDVYKTHAMLTNPDVIKRLEPILKKDFFGEDRLRKLYREYAEMKIGKQGKRNEPLTTREADDLIEFLGHRNEQAVKDLVQKQSKAAVEAERLKVNPPPKPPTPQEIAQAKETKYILDMLDRDPEKLLYEFDSVEKIRRMKGWISGTPEGDKLFKEFSRFKLESMLNKEAFDSYGDLMRVPQLKKLIRDKKARELMKELMSPQAFKDLEMVGENLQELSKSAAKYLNTSGTATVTEEKKYISHFLGYIGLALKGNPGKLAAFVATYIGGAKVAANILTDPEILEKTRKLILANQQNNTSLSTDLWNQIVTWMKAQTAASKASIQTSPQRMGKAIQNKYAQVKQNPTEFAGKVAPLVHAAEQGLRE